MRQHRFINHSEDENVFWITMTDLLLGLLIAFIVLFVFAMVGFTANKMQENQVQYKVASILAQKFKQSNINVEIDKMSGRIKISDLELFELNKWDLSSKGKVYLSKFVPIYLNEILGNPTIKNNISQIIIEGHTDSESFGNTSTQDNYYKNLDLSLKRASSVAQYIIYSNNPKINHFNNDLTRLLSVNGKSFTDPIIVNGKEDYQKSRRVELKIVFKDNSLSKIFKKHLSFKN